MTTILTALAVFILTIVGLVVVLMVARNKLVPSGSVKIFVNDDDDCPIIACATVIAAIVRKYSRANAVPSIVFVLSSTHANPCSTSLNSSDRQFGPYAATDTMPLFDRSLAFENKALFAFSSTH